MTLHAKLAAATFLATKGASALAWLLHTGMLPGPETSKGLSSQRSLAGPASHVLPESAAI